MAADTKKQPSGEHYIELFKREHFIGGGVEDVISFCEDKIELKTGMGRLIIRGKKLNINMLDTENGKLDVTGEIRIMEYTDKKNKESLVTSLFK